MTDVPYHIERVNFETSDAFSRLSGERKTMSDIFDTPFEKIDIELAWSIFNKMYYDQLFKDTKGDHETLSNVYERIRSLERIYNPWAIKYWVMYLQEKGIMDSVEYSDGEVFFFTESYKPSINTLLTASPARLDS